MVKVKVKVRVMVKVKVKVKVKVRVRVRVKVRARNEGTLGRTLEISCPRSRMNRLNDVTVSCISVRPGRVTR